MAEVPRRDWDGARVRDAMLPREQVPVFTGDEELVEALAELGESEVGRGLVLEGERLTGLLSMTAVTRALEVGAPTRRAG